MSTQTMQQEKPLFVGEKPMPKYIRRSVLALSIDDAQLGEKAYASWADAIILDFAKHAGRDWQADLKARMPAAIHAAAKGGSFWAQSPRLCCRRTGRHGVCRHRGYGAERRHRR
jgi:hypothetical protein